jgi:heme o synthase
MYKEKLNIAFELMKIRITIFVMVTMVFGYISFADEFNFGIILPSIGLLLLASGSAAINHWQERKTDVLMDRTKNRPIPSGKISAENVLKFSLILVLIGSLILFFTSGLTALILGLLNLVWYNGIYTPLKKVSSLAIIPGSLVGAIPPMVGWVAAGGYIFAPQILIIAAFFFIWQIPHFWLLLMVFGKDYEQAGFPTLTQKFSVNQLARITFIWIVATAITCLMLPLFGVIKLTPLNLILGFFSGWLIWKSKSLLLPELEKINFKFAFRAINVFALLVIVLLSIEKIILLF